MYEKHGKAVLFNVNSVLNVSYSVVLVVLNYKGFQITTSVKFSFTTFAFNNLTSLFNLAVKK